MSLLGPQLEAFIAITKHNTVHAAASHIHITQTAVTQRIRALERSLKTTLFIRTHKGMMLTQEGEALLRYCQAAKELEGETLANIQGAAIDTDIELTISAPSSMMLSRIIPSCLPIMKNFPRLLLHFDVNDLETRHQSLRSGQVDIAILQDEQVASGMQAKVLQPEQYILVACADWKGRNLKQIIQQERIIDFEESDQMTFNYLRQFDLFEHAQHNRHFVNRTQCLAQLVCAGVGYTTLAKEFAKSYIDRGELIALNRGQAMELGTNLAWFERPEPPSYFNAIIAAIK